MPILRDKGKILITLRNTSDKIAFFLEFVLLNSLNGEPVLPVFWEDNYISLLPGEKRRLTVSFPPEIDSNELKVKVRGLNISGGVY